MSAIRPRKNEEKANAVQELRPDYPLDLLLRYADLARSTFFYHLHGKDKTRMTTLHYVPKFLLSNNRIHIMAIAESPNN